MLVRKFPYFNLLYFVIDKWLHRIPNTILECKKIVHSEWILEQQTIPLLHTI